MIPAIPVMWAGIPEPVRKLLTWIGIGILIFIVGKVAVEALKAEGAQRQREKNAKRQAEIKVAVTERQSEIREEENINADEAIRARDTGPVYPDAASVPDEIADVLFRGSRGGEPNSGGR